MQRANAIVGGLLEASTRLVWLNGVERERTDRGQHNKHTTRLQVSCERHTHMGATLLLSTYKAGTPHEHSTHRSTNINRSRDCMGHRTPVTCEATSRVRCTTVACPITASAYMNIADKQEQGHR